MVNSLRLLKWIEKKILIWRGKQLHKKFEQFFDYIDENIYYACLDDEKTPELKELKECWVCQLSMHDFVTAVDFLVKNNIIKDHETCREERLENAEKLMKRAQEENW